MMFPKYHRMVGALGMAIGLDSVTFFLKNQAERRKCGFLFPLKMLTTLIWYFTQGFKTKRSLNPMLTD